MASLSRSARRSTEDSNRPVTTHKAWILTRPGFEDEGGREWRGRVGNTDPRGALAPYPGLGLACHETPDNMARRIRELPAVESLVFVRDVFFELARIDALPASDRVGALLDRLERSVPGRQWGEVAVHVPAGTNDGDLSSFARKWSAPLSRALRAGGWLMAERNSNARRLDLILLDFQRVIIAESHPGHRAAYPGGRPRLKLPARAPSRSVLKIEEALLTLLRGGERPLAPGMTAVDLGAAPGGWTYALAGRGLSVTAVDNGPMDESLLQTGRVVHRRADGFTWLPDEPVDWMVCDIVDRPRRTVDLVGRWLRGRHCRASIFNLKLPMKKRLEEWRLCRDRLETALAKTGRQFEIRAKQLYHDREEVTVAVLPGNERGLPAPL